MLNWIIYERKDGNAKLRKRRWSDTLRDYRENLSKKKRQVKAIPPRPEMTDICFGGFT